MVNGRLSFLDDSGLESREGPKTRSKEDKTGSGSLGQTKRQHPKNREKNREQREGETPSERETEREGSIPGTSKEREVRIK